MKTAYWISTSIEGKADRIAHTPHGDRETASYNEGARPGTFKTRVHVIWCDFIEALFGLRSEGDDEAELFFVSCHTRGNAASCSLTARLMAPMTNPTLR